jgi:hypothetical protein
VQAFRAIAKGVRADLDEEARRVAVTRGDDPDGVEVVVEQA